MLPRCRCETGITASVSWLRCKFLIWAVTIFICQISLAEAGMRVTQKTSYFLVRGSTASAIFTSLVVHGPGGQSGRAMATTNAKIRQGFTLVQKRRCYLARYSITVKITMRLPRLASPRRLSPSTRRLWRGFYGYLRRHENHHRAIYIACARRMAAQAGNLARSKSCVGVSSALARLRNTELAKCERRHNAYDRRESGLIKRLGLIRRATRVQTNVKRR